jgi:transaldolase/glucose-6-phosphate isomerase
MEEKTAMTDISTSLGQYAASVDEAMADLEAERIVARIWDHDYTVWKPEPTEISNRLGWLHIAQVMKQNTCYIKAVTDAVRADGYTHALLLGMGGSSLAPEVFRKTFGVKDEYLDLSVLDSTDPGAVLAHAERLEMERTLFIVATKSGGTEETLSFFRFFYNQVADAVGADHAGEHFVAITDPGTGLIDLARKHSFRDVFLNDPTIGGRYSALSYFGLVPAMLVGVNVDSLLDRATGMMESCKSGNTGARLGVIMGALAVSGRDKVTLVASPPISAFGAWVEQLIAESTGKEGKGILPVDGEELGAPEVYGQDRLFVYLRLAGDNTYDNAVQALRDGGQPVVQIDLQDLYDLGGEFFRWEFATAVAGHILGINPFDQPNVEAAKVLAREMVSAYKEKGELLSMTPKLESDGITVYATINEDSLEGMLDSFLKQAKPGDYVAIQAYVQPTQETSAALQQLRMSIRDHSKLATTVGYGPRFLHSTGQLHKGDAGNGLFIQLTADSNPQDAAIPDEAGSLHSSIGFGAFKDAQALGDLRALLDAWRRVIRVHLGHDVKGGSSKLMESLSLVSKNG